MNKCKRWVHCAPHPHRRQNCGEKVQKKELKMLWIQELKSWDGGATLGRSQGGEFTFLECETSVSKYGWAVTVFETVEEEGGQSLSGEGWYSFIHPWQYPQQSWSWEHFIFSQPC